MRTIVYNKLVRDRIPEIIRQVGKKCVVTTLASDAQREYLNAKLAEETQEYLKSGDLAELDDLEEVIRAIIHLNGLTPQAFDDLREAKRLANGGFDKGCFLVSVDEPE